MYKHGTPNAPASPAQASTSAPREVVVRLPDALVRLFPDAPRKVMLPAATVGEAIDALDARWPGMRDRICDSRPAIRRHINVFVQGERATLDTPLPAGGEMLVFTAISGG
jgi:molybdopterin converting factor small subunit